MSRRVALPDAAELFRQTGPAPQPAGASEPEQAEAPQPVGAAPGAVARNTTGRQRHEEKITVYVSATELVELESARLALRAQYGIAADRGRIVREAISIVVRDLELKGESSAVVKRLRGQ